MFFVYKEKHSVDIWCKTKLHTYCLTQDDYGAERYIKYDLNKEPRSLSAQFCSAMLLLALETDRFNDTAGEDRL